jgi:uncharacterized protein
MKPRRAVGKAASAGHHPRSNSGTHAAMITLAEIRVFPVKSLRGALHPSALVQDQGLENDRRWMVVDATGRFLTQREHPRMALLSARIEGTALHLAAPGVAPLHVTPPPQGTASRTVTIWNDLVTATDAGDAAAQYLTHALATPCRLVHLANPAGRPVRPDYARPGEVVSFADGFPLLLASAASLADLNSRLAAPIPILRFRPNLVVTGAPPWEEDTWRRIRIGDAIFRVAKPCDRCVITTIDPETAERPNPVEPVRTLGAFRRDTRGGVMFGQNLVPERCTTLHLGDELEVLESGPPNVQLAEREPATSPP